MKGAKNDTQNECCVHGGGLYSDLSFLAAFAVAKETSYAPVAINKEFDSIVARMKTAKPEVMERQMNLLKARYDLSEYPAAIFLTTRPDLGDVLQGKFVTINNYYEMFNGILNPSSLKVSGC